uniref:WW domain-containing protein n=1 Tax=Polytomella parva TaxID=51329 RepID=A0A7S0YAY8_9CHLO|mmetsp:Transcript_19256/g.34822  ORF Transcript_19256/g.34822 Transcript_19256/m.34822 type:complete len:456 (+) Transcript_19256:96-1463(+)|eukprot:CAMPEP_0175041022 /NCGR_PEP_ID=MMETSP0052_2-20121109/1654_1 /TAXON_ID=51329 ORGANISM="Polytomella parva, Strain SAG 63-3" /NCGR_SAMPLE_ID=MMETSP0052_2 /ASSEMBLY_ACC=CAM_ASM_000194 /LENGTH=455 /DNA_ID=CAMNT_0016303431 /DNA_START=79 /DNA_END=1446 /DNA_ORIENTATION=+
MSDFKEDDHRQEEQEEQVQDGDEQDNGYGIPENDAQNGDFNDDESKQYKMKEAGKRKLDSSDSTESKTKHAAYEGADGFPTSTTSASADTDEVTEFFQCPASKVGKLIGKSGATIKDLEGRSNTKLQVDQNASGNEKPVRITGTRANVENAKKLILEQINSENPVSVGEDTRQIECPKFHVGRVIGRGGENIRLMQRASGATIMVIQDVPEGQPCLVKITGLPRAVEIAVNLVTYLTSSENVSIQSAIQKFGLGKTKVISCPKIKVGCVIGRGGATIKDLQKRNLVSIEVKQDCNPCEIVLTGLDEDLPRVEGAIMELITGNRTNAPFGKAASAGFPGAFPSNVGGFVPNSYNNAGYNMYQGNFPAYSGYPYSVPNTNAYPGYGNAAGYASNAYGAAAAAAAATFGGAYPNVGDISASSVPSGGNLWQVVSDGQRPYYYNASTGQSQWEKPADMP